MPQRDHGKLAETWWGSANGTSKVTLGAASWVGADYSFTVAGRVAGVRFYCDSGMPNPAIAVIVERGSSALLRAVAFNTTSAGGGRWVHAWFRPWYRVAANTELLVWVLAFPAYYRTNTGLSGGAVTHTHHKMNASMQSTSLYPPISPTFNNNENSVDLLFHPT